LARSLVYYLILVPYRHVIHPAIRYLLNHKAEAAIAGVCLALLFLVSPIIWIVPLAATALVLGTIAFEVYTHQRHDPLIHDPALPRNEAMDIYTNKISETFTVEELRDYYRAKRCELKDKNPRQPSLNSHVLFTSLSKQQVMAARTPKLLQQTVTIEASKAKIHDIKQTIRLIHRIGFHQPEKLKAELVQQQHDYVIGKNTPN